MTKGYFPTVKEMIETCRTVSNGQKVYKEIAFDMGSVANSESIFAKPGTGFTYQRFGSPTNVKLEQAFAYMNGGESAVLTNNGTSANYGLITTLLGKSGELLSSRHLFGGTYGMFNELLQDNGHKTRWFDPRDPRMMKKQITKNTRAIFIETISNADNVIPEFDGIAEIAQEYNLPLVVDNTLATTLLFQPIKDAHANFVTDSATKYPSGDNKALGGVIVSANNFDFKDDPRYPHINRAPYKDAIDPAMAKIRKNVAAGFGSGMESRVAHHISRRMASMPERLYAQQKNAQAIAEFLQEQQGIVKSVRFAGLESDPDHARMKKYLRGPGSIILVDFGTKEKAAQFADNTKFGIRVHVGQEKTMNTHSATTTHRQFDPTMQELIGVRPGTIRISVGAENQERLMIGIRRGLRHAS